MNRPLLLHLVERLEGLVGRLPGTIQKPILSELTPLKELFLRQRPPRFAFAGSSNAAMGRILPAVFPAFSSGIWGDAPVQRIAWREYIQENCGSIAVLDAREFNATAKSGFEELLEQEPADVIFYVDEDGRRRVPKTTLEQLVSLLNMNDRKHPRTSLVAIILSNRVDEDARADLRQRAEKLEAVFQAKSEIRDRFIRVFSIPSAGHAGGDQVPLTATIARLLPNEARLEMVRSSGDRVAQAEIAKLLVKSTTAMCTAIGTQPIPLADLPILTSLQIVMVTGIMYVSGRERSVRAASEFVGALGANIGAGMLLREGTRAILKFIPGWGNVVCGMVAGAGTYGIGRAAIAYFLEGVSLKDARRTYLAGRKRPRSSLSPTAAPKRLMAPPAKGPTRSA